jgi:GxxExxY protein
MEVHRLCGPGFSEKIYEEALARELSLRGIAFERQKKLAVSYKGSEIGEYFLDLVVEEKIIVELKAVPEILPLHCAQALSYLKASGLRLAIVVNFGGMKLT